MGPQGSVTFVDSQPGISKAAATKQSSEVSLITDRSVQSVGCAHWRYKHESPLRVTFDSAHAGGEPPVPAAESHLKEIFDFLAKLKSDFEQTLGPKQATACLSSSLLFTVNLLSEQVPPVFTWVVITLEASLQYKSLDKVALRSEQASGPRQLRVFSPLRVESEHTSYPSQHMSLMHSLSGSKEILDDEQVCPPSSAEQHAAPAFSTFQSTHVPLPSHSR